MAPLSAISGVLTQIECCRLNFRPEQKLALAGTIQFAASLQAVREQLAPLFPSLAVPQSRPLSPGIFTPRSIASAKLLPLRSLS